VSVVVDPARAFFAWKHHHPQESEDVSAVWGAAWRAGGRAAIEDSARLVQLVPLLRDLLDSLEDGRVEQDVMPSDRRPRVNGEDFGDLEAEPDCRVSW
jgi:hypothetical protein